MSVFDPASLDAAIRQELAGVVVPPGKHGVVVGVVTEHGGHLAIAVPFAAGWVIGGYVTVFDHTLGYGVQVKGYF